jgi:hypothetical protein
MGLLTVHLTDAAEEKLRIEAKAAGKEVAEIASEVLTAHANLNFGELSAEVRKRFLQSGMSEDELADLLEKEDHASRGVRYDE